MQEINSKIKTRFDVFVLVIFSYFILHPILFLLASYYEEAIALILGSIPYEKREAVLNNQHFKLLFKISKIGLFFILIWLAALWFDYFTTRKKAFTSFLVNKISTTLCVSYNNNKTFLMLLNKEIRVGFLLIMVVFLIAQTILLINIPINYDELFSYVFFSSKGLWTSLSHYPVPNNHVLYNIVTTIFIKLPVDVEISIKIPALLAAILTLYYFFKLAYNQFDGKIALVLTIFIACLYPFQLFSISARGYAFVNLFCVLLLYATTKLSATPTSKKYRWVFIASSFGGMFAVPSFLYVLFVVYTVYFIYLFLSKQKKAIALFIKDSIISGGLTILGYLLIVLMNEKGALTNPNGGATKFSLSDPAVVTIIINHIKEISTYLFFNQYTLFIAYPVLVICMVFLFINKKINSSFLMLLSFFMLLSPLIILPLHRVLPFSRNWLYLVFPGALCLGFLLHSFSLITAGFFERFTKIEIAKKVFFVSLAAYLFSLARFEKNHRSEYGIDYEIATIRKEYIDAEIRNIQSLSITHKTFEYYPAEYIQFVCYIHDPKRGVSVTPLDSVTMQDILIIEKSEEERFKSQLSNYRLLRYFDGNLSVYCRNKP